MMMRAIGAWEISASRGPCVPPSPTGLPLSCSPWEGVRWMMELMLLCRDARIRRFVPVTALSLHPSWLSFKKATSQPSPSPAAFLAAAARRTVAADPAAFAPTRFTSAIAANNSEDDEGSKADAPQAPILPTLAFTRTLTLEARPAAAAAVEGPPSPSPPSSAPLVVFGIDPDVTGALAVVAVVQGSAGGGGGDALRAALAAWEEAGGGPGAAGAASAAASATAAAARSSFALVSVHDTPIENVAVGKALRSRPDPAAVVALVAAAATAARARVRDDARGAPPLPSSGPSPSPLLAVIERPAPGFNNGRLSWLATGYAYGVWRAALAAAGVPVLSVPAAAWKKDLGLLKQGKDASRELAGAWLGGEEGGTTAAAAAAAATAAAAAEPSSTGEEGAPPSLTAKGGLLGRKRDHGRAEAALIALWGAAIGRAGVGGRLECEGVATGPVETATAGPAGRRTKAGSGASATAAVASRAGTAGSGRRTAVAAAGAVPRAGGSTRRAASTKATPPAPARGPGASEGEGGLV